VESFLPKQRGRNTNDRDYISEYFFLPIIPNLICLILARDHGIPGYNRYRELCNLTRAKDFSDLEDTTRPELVETLRRLYQHVDDIDLFPGGMSESPLPGALIGPTFACIIARQFNKIRRCDRFW
jgi:hypothetical protein